MRVLHQPIRWLLAIFVLLGFAAVTTLPTYAQQAPPFDPDAIPAPESPPSALSGARIYMEDCAPCHGPTGESDGPVVQDLPAPPPRFADPETTWAISPAEYFHTAKYGRLEGLMPPWENSLSDEDIWQVTSYARSLHTGPDIVDAGAELYVQSCVACHGETGAGDGPEATGDESDYSDLAAMMLVTDADLSQEWNRTHADQGEEWTPDERRAVLDYIRTFTYVPAWVSPYQASDGVVEGQLEQGTPDGPQPGNAPVQLYAYLDFEQVALFETITDEQGRFRFEELSTSGDIDYIIDADYADVTHNSEFFKLTDEQPSQAITITVYEVGDDDSQIVIPRGNVLIDHQPGALAVAQILTFSNRSDRTFAGKPIDGADRLVTVSVKVPEEATDIRFADGELGGRYLRIGDTVYDTVALAPGEEMRQTFVSYMLPYDGDSATITQSWAYPVDLINMLVAELPQLAVESDQLTYDSNDTLQGIEFELWTGENAGADEEITASFTGLLAEDDVDPRAQAVAPGSDSGAVQTARPQKTSSADLQKYTVVAIVGVLAALLLIVLVIIGLRRTKVDPEELLAQERDELIEQIAALDDQHARGELDTIHWSNQRARLKSRLIEVASV